MKQTIRIATRKSQLALWQANHIKQQLIQNNPGLDVLLVPLTTEGDRHIDTPLIDVGGKALFTKELEIAMLNDQADMAVHSAKDVPFECEPGFDLMICDQRADARDVLVSKKQLSLDQLPEGAIVGTASIRRQAQLLHLRPDLIIKPIRGNVPTRLDKLQNQDYDAIILAAAGLQRLGLTEHITQYFANDECYPAVGQGALAIEYRAGDEIIQSLLTPLVDQNTQTCVEAERQMNATLGGHCHAPIGVSSKIDEDQLTLTGIVASADGKQIIQATHSGHHLQAKTIGTIVANALIDQGANRLLKPKED